tara:strand:+ start:1467 stop:1784 length:318 start_codon:yes stop_codon:yes gene_type:complete
MVRKFDTHEELLEALKAFYRYEIQSTPPGEQEKLKAREEYYRKRFAERPKPKPRPKKLPVTRYIRFIQLPENEYARERRVFAPPRIRPSRDAQHRSWDGYEWSIV